MAVKSFTRKNISGNRLNNTNTFTSYSVSFNGSSQYLNTPTNAAFGFGTGDFTIEFWVYFNSVSGNQQLIDTRPTGTSSTVNYLALTSIGGTINYYTAGNNPSIGGSTLVASRWYHIAICKASGNTRLFIDGIQSGSTYVDSTTYASGTNRPIIGVDGNNPTVTFLNGYISNLRILKGTALYTANFTAPTATLLPITNTILLTCQSETIIDNSGYNYTITTTGAPTVSTSIKPF